MTAVLPYELIDNISIYIDIKDVTRLRSTCKRYRDIGIIHHCRDPRETRVLWARPEKQPTAHRER